MIRGGSNPGGPTVRASWRSSRVVDPRASFRKRRASSTPNRVRTFMRAPMSNEDERLQIRPLLHLRRARAGGYGSCGKRSEDSTFPTSYHSHYCCWSPTGDNERTVIGTLGIT